MSLLHHFILTCWVNLEMGIGRRTVPRGAVFVITYSLKDTRVLDFKAFICNCNKISQGIASIRQEWEYSRLLHDVIDKSLSRTDCHRERGYKPCVFY